MVHALLILLPIVAVQAGRAAAPALDCPSGTTRHAFQYSSSEATASLDHVKIMMRQPRRHELTVADMTGAHSTVAGFVRNGEDLPRQSRKKLFPRHSVL